MKNVVTSRDDVIGFDGGQVEKDSRHCKDRRDPFCIHFEFFEGSGGVAAGSAQVGVR
jgi:hypothetical protein